MKWKQFMLIVAISAVSAVSSVWIYGKYSGKKTVLTQGEIKLPVNYAGYFDNITTAEPVDFTKAANAAVPAVVHIKTTISAKKISNDLPNRKRNGNIDDWFNDLFNFGPTIIPEQKASGSGVIISD